MWPAPSPHHDNLSACSSQIYILLNKRHIFLLFISPQILYLCYCHVRARSCTPAPSLPSGASHRVCCRNHLICRLWSARSRDDPSRREQKSPRWGVTSLADRIGDASLTKRSVAADSSRELLALAVSLHPSETICAGKNVLKIFEHIDIRRAPPPLFLVCTKSLISIAERFCLRVEAFH